MLMPAYLETTKKAKLCKKTEHIKNGKQQKAKLCKKQKQKQNI